MDHRNQSVDDHLCCVVRDIECDDVLWSVTSSCVETIDYCIQHAALLAGSGVY